VVTKEVIDYGREERGEERKRRDSKERRS